MEQDSKKPKPQFKNHDPQSWARDLLELEAGGAATTEKETRTDALVSFFTKLHSNDFLAPNGNAEAVEIIHGKSPDLLPAFLRTHQKEQLQQLDDIVEWFAGKLGNHDHQQLLATLSRRLSDFKFEGASTKVKNYGKKIWAAAQSVASPVNESNAATKKIAQGLFHISTIRPSKRRDVRHQHVSRLKNEFSKLELMEARKVIWGNYVVPNEAYHKPFLSLLTYDEAVFDSYQIADPVYAGAQTVPYATTAGSTASSRAQEDESTNWRLFGIIAICCIGALVRISFFAMNNKTKPSRNSTIVTAPNFKPNLDIKFDPNLPADDPRSIESAMQVLRRINGEDSDLPTAEEFQELKDKAETAKRRMKERQDPVMKAMREAEERVAQQQKGNARKK